MTSNEFFGEIIEFEIILLLIFTHFVVNKSFVWNFVMYVLTREVIYLYSPISQKKSNFAPEGFIICSEQIFTRSVLQFYIILYIIINLESVDEGC